jgi:integrase
MPSIRLTQVAVDKLKPPARGRVVFWDRHLPGFGVRITDNGAKSWIVTYRVNRKFVMETIGSVALIPKVDEARNRARASMLEARGGINPVGEKKLARAQQEDKAKEAQRKTVSFVVGEYFSRYVDKKYRPSSAKETRRTFEKDMLPRWGNRDITTIARADVRSMLNDVEKRGASAANHLLAMLKTFFVWVVSEEIYGDQNPTTNLKPPCKDVARDRVLADDEIVSFWNASEKIGWPYGPLFKMLLLTAQRRNEIGRMTWDEIDLGNAVWTIPKERAKNGNAHIVQLSDCAVEIFKALPRINGSRYVFTTAGTTPVNGWSAAKAALDKRMGEGESFTLHDLRRTAASGMAQLGILPHVVDKILNHTSGKISGVAATYNRFEYAPERKAALETWARYVESLVHPGPSNVVPLTQRV